MNQSHGRVSRAALRPGVSVVRHALALMFAGAILTALPVDYALAQQNTAAYDKKTYAIDAGPLGSALSQLATNAGISLAVETSVVAGKYTRGLQGSYSAYEALSQLLDGTGLEVFDQGNGNYSVRRPVPTQSHDTTLPTVTVTSQVSNLTEGSGSYGVSAVNVGTKTAQSLREVPRSISVLTRAQLDDQNIASFNEAIEQLPGITLTPADGWGGGGYLARGHTISSFMVDGSPAMGKTEGDFSLNTSMAKYDSVQFLHGPDGLFAGNGQPSGTINLVRKRPMAQRQFKTTMSAGSWENYLGEADLSTPLTESGNVRGRFVAAYNDAHKFYDYAHRKTSTLYGIVSIDLSPRTIVNVGLSRDTRKGQGQDYPTALPRYTNGDLLPVPRSIGLPALSYLDNTSENYFAELDHAFNDDWRMRINASTTRSSNSVFLPYYSGAVDPSTGTGSRIFQFTEAYEGEVRARSLDAHLSGKFSAFDRKHRVTLGADYLRTHNTGAISSVQGIGGMLIDWSTFDPGSLTSFTANAPTSFRDNMNVQKGVYGYGDFQIQGALRLVLGGRYAQYENNDARYRTGRPFVPAISRNSGYFSPYYALIYDLSNNWTVYATHTRSYEDQSNRYDAASNPLDPTIGKSFEIGLKGEHWDGRLNTNLTIYRTNRTNYAVKTSDDPGFDVFGGTCCYSGDGEFQAQGVEMQVSGQVLPGWQINGGYTFDDNKTSYGATNGARYNTSMPKHIFRIWTSYRLQENLSRFRVGGGVLAQSSFFKEGAVRSWNPTSGVGGTGAYDGPEVPYAFTDPGRAIWNFFTEYTIDKHWRLALNVNNVFDKRYLQSVGTTAGGNVYGEPRNVMLSLRGQF